MRSYAAEPWHGAVEAARARRRCRIVFTALKIAATASVVGAIIGETPALDPGRARRRDPQLQPVLLDRPANLWATNIVAALLGIAFFVAIVLAEKLVVRRAPEHIA